MTAVNNRKVPLSPRKDGAWHAILNVSLPSGESEDPKGKGRKTGWDKASVISQVIGALAIPIAIAGLLWGVYQFNTQQSSNAQMQATQLAANAQLQATQVAVTQAQALDQQRQTTLDTYLDRMSDLLLMDHLAASKPGDQVQALAVART